MWKKTDTNRPLGDTCNGHQREAQRWTLPAPCQLAPGGSELAVDVFQTRRFHRLQGFGSGMYEENLRMTTATALRLPITAGTPAHGAHTETQRTGAGFSQLLPLQWKLSPLLPGAQGTMGERRHDRTVFKKTPTNFRTSS